MLTALIPSITGLPDRISQAGGLFLCTKARLLRTGCAENYHKKYTLLGVLFVVKWFSD
jgi:hypothetical protein